MEGEVVHRGRLLLAVVILLVISLTACSGSPAPETPGVATATPEAGSTPAEPVTETPTPFKTELVLCTTSEPAALLGNSDRTADAIRQMVLPSAVSYGSAV